MTNEVWVTWEDHEGFRRHSIVDIARATDMVVHLQKAFVKQLEPEVKRPSAIEVSTSENGPLLEADASLLDYFVEGRPDDAEHSGRSKGSALFLKLPPQRQQQQQQPEDIIFDPSEIHRYPEFQPDGFGPFIVKREALLSRIISEANPQRSVHISGCKGCGKTTLLKLIGEELVNRGETVYYFLSATQLTDCHRFIIQLVRNQTKAFFLIDETQSVAENLPVALVRLLKNHDNHFLTTIGAGVPYFKTLSARFDKQHTTHELFLTEKALIEEGIVDYFDKSMKGFTILKHIRDHCGGHIFPLMRGMELLKKDERYEMMTATEVISLYDSAEFRNSDGYQAICTRVLPPVGPDEIRPLFYSTREIGSLEVLKKKGFVSSEGKILSRLLLDAYVASLSTNRTHQTTNLRSGVEGIKQILQTSLPGLKWSHYDAHGGPVQDALSFELLKAMSSISQLTSTLFNPKPVDVGTAGRRPDIFINSTVNSYIECVLTHSHRETDKVTLDEHIDRFCEQANEHDVRYRLLEGQDWAILNFQLTGVTPLNPSPEFAHLFEERVFTFLMASRNLFRGNVHLQPQRVSR